MDNLTHSLIGAALGQAGLKRRTGLAMPALVIGANLPDIDAPCVIFGVESLSMRRGITHGPIALVILPLLLAGTLIWFDHWQAQRGRRPETRAPVDAKWLLALCYLGTLTHPLFDWFNNYGIRLLEPFSSQWFYGDTLFIIDVWIWAMLGLGVWLSRKRERSRIGPWTRPARTALAGVAGYTMLNFAISDLAEMQVRGEAPYPRKVVANSVPLAFWRRDVLWQGNDGAYGTFRFSFPYVARPESPPRTTGMSDPRIAEWAKHNRAARAFLFWSRMPVAAPDGGGIVLRDQRFMQPVGRGNFSVELAPPKQDQSER